MESGDMSTLQVLHKCSISNTDYNYDMILLSGTKLWDHLLRQHLVRHVDGLPVHHDGGVDQHAVLGE